MSWARQQVIIFLILLDISRSKENQTMKFDQLIENNLRIFFSSKLMRKMRQGVYFRNLLLGPLFVFFEKDVYKTKATNQRVSFNIFR